MRGVAVGGLVAIAAFAAACGDNRGGGGADARPDGSAIADARVGDDAPAIDAGPDGAIDASPVPAVVRINELNPKLAGGCDLVELRVVAGGSLDGFVLRQRTSDLVAFAGLSVATNDYVLVHLNGGDAACNPGTSADEVTAPDAQPAATFAANVDTAFDWYSAVTDLDPVSNVLSLVDATDAYVDVVCIHDSGDGPIAAPSLTAADAAAAAGQWPVVAGGYTAAEFRSHAVDDLVVDTTRGGRPLARNSNLDNNVAAGDWTDTNVASSFGANNVGQVNF